MLVLRDSEVRQLVTIEDGFAACEASYRYYGEVRNVLSEPAAAYLVLPKEPPVKCRYKAAHMASLGVAGARLATPGHYYCWVTDIKTGEPIGLVNETWHARRRTATTAAIVSKWLARPEAKVATLFGAGKIGDEIYRHSPMHSTSTNSVSLRGISGMLKLMRSEMESAQPHQFEPSKHRKRQSMVQISSSP